MQKGLFVLHTLPFLLPKQLALHSARVTVRGLLRAFMFYFKWSVMYENMNPACIKAVLTQMKEKEFKRHFSHILKQSVNDQDLNKQAMFYELQRYCFFMAKTRFPKLNVLDLL